MAGGASITPDGKYLFFSSSRKNPDLPKIRSGSSVIEIIKTNSVPGYGHRQSIGLIQIFLKN
jgi:hypothetical protein